MLGGYKRLSRRPSGDPRRRWGAAARTGPGWCGSAAVVDQVEGLVVVRGVVVLPDLVTRHDPAGSARVGARRDDRVLVVVARTPARQDALPVLEDGAVLVEREGAARVDEIEGVVRLRRQRRVADAADGGGRGSGRRRRRDGAGDEEDGQKGGDAAERGDPWGIRMPTMMTRVDTLPSTPTRVNLWRVNRAHGYTTRLTRQGCWTGACSPVGAGKRVTARQWGMHPVTVFDT